MVDLNEIKSFVEIVNNFSLSKAAIQIGVPKSTLSRHLFNLENRLGHTLILRTTRKLKLTKTGEEFYINCKKILSDFYEAEKKIQESLDSPKGLIRFTASAEAGFGNLPSTIAQFMNNYPDIKIDIMLTDRVVDLIQEGFDVALRSGKSSDPNIVTKKIASETFVCVASPSYLLQNGIPKTPSDLTHHRCLIFSAKKNPTKWRFQNLKSKKNSDNWPPPIDVVLTNQNQISSINMTKKICIAGGGIAYLPKFVVQDSLLAGELQLLFPDWEGPTGTHHICFPLMRNQPLRVRLFIDFLFKNLSENK